MPQSNLNLIQSLAHEMRQPLSTIESIAYYLELALPHAEPRVIEQLTRLRYLVAQSGWMLSDALVLAQDKAPQPEHVDLDELLSEYVFEQMQHDSAQDLFELELGGVPVCMDYAQARHMVQGICRLMGGVVKPGAKASIRTDLLSSGKVLLRARAESVSAADVGPAAGANLIVECLERIAGENGATLLVHLGDPTRLELTLEVAAAPRFPEGSEESGAFQEDEQREPTAPSTL